MLPRNELDGIVATLNDLFRWHLSPNKPADQVKNREIHERDFRAVKPFLDPVFALLNEGSHWQDVRDHPPHKIEVELRPMSDEDRKHFPNAGAEALTLHIELPEGCMKNEDGTSAWGSRMPNKFHFEESKDLPGFYVPPN